MQERLSRPHAQLKESYDAVVIGSGYGGAVAAMRLAAAGLSVCVLERGRERLPGDFPHKLHEIVAETAARFPRGHVGFGDGLYQLHVGQDIVVGAPTGLGGGSLINSGVLRRPPAALFQDARWPRAIREADLSAYYERAAARLDATPYPDHFPPLSKLQSLQDAGARVGHPVETPPITVRFTDGPNRYGAHRRACNLCGQCNAGCNHGAKNSLDVTYLFQASQDGAQIFAEMEARHIERGHTGVGWVVHCRGQKAHQIQAGAVVVSAGVIGTSKILLRSQRQGLSLSPRLGEALLTNGTMLGVGYNTDRRTNSRGLSPEGSPEAPVGPSITGALRLPLRSGQPILVEDGAHPAFAITAMRYGMAARNLKHSGLTGLLPDRARDALDRTMNWLVVGDDGEQRRITLPGRDVSISSAQGDAGAAYTEAVHDALGQLTEALGGSYTDADPRVTFHPLGGAAMADTAKDGVVDHAGRVFAEAQGDAVHPGLYVIDGSIFPVAIGENPILSITAFAERCMDHCLQDIPRMRPPPPRPRNRSVRFHETMRGSFVSLEPALGDSAAAFRLTVRVDPELLDQPGPHGSLTGHVRIPAFSSAWLPIEPGAFTLLTHDRDRVGAFVMQYAFTFRAPSGEIIAFRGRKWIEGSFFLQGWEQTTRLSYALSQGTRTLGHGVLTLSARAFLRQLSTMRADTLSSLAALGRSFAARIGQAYHPQLFGTLGENRGGERHPPRQTVHLTTPDGALIQLDRFRGGDRGPVLVIHGYAATRRLFTLDTVPENLVEHLCRRGHDVWLLGWRAQGTLPSARQRLSLDAAAKHDIPLAAQHVHAETGCAPRYVAHCAGAQLTLMSAMGGHLPARLQGPMVLMQLGAYWDVRHRLERLKVSTRLPSLLDAVGVRYLPIGTLQGPSRTMRALDAALRLYPIHRKERCSNPLCRRHAAMFGELVRHAQLNPATHERMGDLLENAPISGLSHFAQIVRAGELVDSTGQLAYLDGASRIRAPVRFLYSTHNAVVGPGSTRKTHALLQRLRPDLAHEWRALEGYGHLDALIGRNAHREVFPLISEHLENHRALQV